MLTRRKRVVLTTGRTEHIKEEPIQQKRDVNTPKEELNKLCVKLNQSRESAPQRVVICLFFFYTTKIPQITIHTTNTTFVIAYYMLVTYGSDTVFKLKYYNRIFAGIW